MEKLSEIEKIALAAGAPPEVMRLPIDALTRAVYVNGAYEHWHEFSNYIESDRPESVAAPPPPFLVDLALEIKVLREEKTDFRSYLVGRLPEGCSIRLQSVTDDWLRVRCAWVLGLIRAGFLRTSSWRLRGGVVVALSQDSLASLVGGAWPKTAKRKGTPARAVVEELIRVEALSEYAPADGSRPATYRFLGTVPSTPYVAPSSKKKHSGIYDPTSGDYLSFEEAANRGYFD